MYLLYHLWCHTVKQIVLEIAFVNEEYKISCKSNIARCVCELRVEILWKFSLLQLWSCCAHITTSVITCATLWPYPVIIFQMTATYFLNFSEYLHWTTIALDVFEGILKCISIFCHFSTLNVGYLNINSSEQWIYCIQSITWLLVPW